jgi:hypothetical protein
VSAHRPEMAETFDVVVVGGGAAGVAAALGAAGAGARVALLERTGAFGGAAVTGSVLTYCGFYDQRHRQVVAGVGQRFLDLLARQDLMLTRTSVSGHKVVLLDLETTKRTLDELVLGAGIHSLLHVDVVAADGDYGRVHTVTYAHAGTLRRLAGAAFVDASGDGALLAAAGADHLTAAAEERQSSTLVLRFGGVAAGADLSSNGAARAIAAYRDRTGHVFARARGPLVRLPVSGEVMALFVDRDEDMLDPVAVTVAEQRGRAEAVHYWRALRAGLPGWADSHLATTGPAIGVRETRRLAGRALVTGDHVVEGGRDPRRVVARGGWPVEDHVSAGRTVYREIRDGAWYDVPLDATRSASHENLWAAGRLLSSDRVAYASTRVMGTAFATGHAAGIAAALHAATGTADVGKVQEELRRQGALL